MDPETFSLEVSTCFLDLTVQRGGLGVHVPTDAKGRMCFGAGYLFFGPAHVFSGPRCVSPGPRVNEQCCGRKYVFVGPACEAFHILLDPCAFFLDLYFFLRRYAHAFRTLPLGGDRPGVLRQRV